MGPWRLLLDLIKANLKFPGFEFGLGWPGRGQDSGRVLTRTLGEYFTGGDPLIFISD